VAFTEDLEKLCAALTRVSSIRYGYLVTYFQKQDKDRHRKKSLSDVMAHAHDRIAEAAQAIHGRSCRSLKAKIIAEMDDEGGPWRAGALITRLANN
jgi:hypothetical protein